MNCLLDTCTLLWLSMEQAALSDSVRDLFADPDMNFHVSSITAFEIGQKYSEGKLELPMNPEKWFPLGLELHGLISLPLEHDIALKAAALPKLHADPFDRLLIATVIENRLTLLTPDTHIRQYPGVATMW